MLELLLAALAAARVFLRKSAGYSPGNPRPASAARRAEAETTAAPIESAGPAVLDWLAPYLVALAEVLVVVKPPQTVVGWHRAGFRFF